MCVGYLFVSVIEKGINVVQKHLYVVLTLNNPLSYT